MGIRQLCLEQCTDRCSAGPAGIEHSGGIDDARWRTTLDRLPHPVVRRMPYLPQGGPASFSDRAETPEPEHALSRSERYDRPAAEMGTGRLPGNGSTGEHRIDRKMG